MRHLPLFAALRGRDCLVVGGGAVAERRARLLLSAGARVTVRAPHPSPALEALAAERADGLALERAPVLAAFDDAAVEPYWLVVAATDDRNANAAVAAAAGRAKRFCNVVDDPELCSFIMPAVVERDPVTVAISSSGAAPVLSRWIKGLIETMLPARLGALARLAGEGRARVRAAVPDADRRRDFWQAVVEGPIAAHVYAGRDEAAAAELESALERTAAGAAAGVARGEAYLVGAGPGHPDLITLRGRQLLAAADVVLYDRLAAPELLAFARRDAELVSVGKSPDRPSITQTQINRLLVQLVGSGKRVCRLKGGDPLVFGRGGEEIEALVEAGLPFQIVPGVSAVEGCAAYAGIPLTLRGVSQAVVIATGHTKDHASADLASFRPGQTLALYMGVRHYEAIREALLAAGHDPATPAALVERGTTDAQRVVRTILDLLPEARDRFHVTAPALLLVGPTAALAERFAWFAPGRLEVLDCRRPGAVAHVS